MSLTVHDRKFRVAVVIRGEIEIMAPSAGVAEELVYQRMDDGDYTNDIRHLVVDVNHTDEVT